MKLSLKLKFLIVVLFIIILDNCIIVNAETSSYIYKTVKTSTITSGATLQNITMLTKNGWINVKQVKVNLSNPNIKVDTLYNLESINKPTNVKNLAKLNSSVAAINGNFFNYIKENNEVSPIGFLMNSEKLLSVDTELNSTKNVFSSFNISKNNTASISYLKSDMKIVAPNGKSDKVLRYNKPYIYHEDLCIIDSKMSKYSIGSDNPTKELAEMLVVDGTVKEIRDSNPKIEIPENGYIVIGRKTHKNFLLQNFKIGDEVILDVKTSVDWKTLKSSITGGSAIIINGNTPKVYSHDASNASRNPRTTIGIDKSGKNIFFVTVDGRQKTSIGMSMFELSDYLLSIGCYNAINLDGGGSTSIVARKEGDFDVSNINSPSDGNLRNIASGIGIFSNLKSNSISKLKLITSNVLNNVIVGNFLDLKVSAFDEYDNPLKFNDEDVNWSIDNSNAQIKDGKLYANSKGKIKLTASINGVSTSIEIKILPKISLEVDSDYIEKINPNGKKILVFGQNSKEKNILEQLYIKNLCKKVNKNYDSVVFIGNTEHKTSYLYKPSLSTNKDNKSIIIGDSMLIQLDLNSRSLKSEAEKNWTWFLNQLNSNFNGNNIFIFSTIDPYFMKDELELDIFKEVLNNKSLNKNIWVIYNGTKNDVFTNENVKFISVANFNDFNLTPEKDSSYEYLLINILNGEATYTFKSLFED
ncbi:MAG: phosphodiester glycosidase family protein [Clostridiales bacterium]